MKRFAPTLAILLFAALGIAPSAQASFGLNGLDVAFENQDGSISTQAGAHPFALTTSLGLNTRPSEEAGFDVPDGDAKDLIIPQMKGLVGNPNAVPPCSNADFAAKTCPRSSQVGVNEVEFEEPGNVATYPVYSIEPPPGVPVKIGFTVLSLVPVTVEIGLSESPPYNVIASLTDISNTVAFYHSRISLWGVPAAHSHDAARGGEAGIAPKPFLTAPRACAGPLATAFKADSWQSPGAWFEESVLTHDESIPPRPQGMTGCGQLGFAPQIAAAPTSRAASSATGLDFSLDVNNEGLANPSEEARADADIEKTVVTLPEGMTANPSSANGLGVCTEAQLAQMSAASAPSVGCPDASKLGTVEVETPLLEGTLLKGALFLAQPYENPEHTLIALYVVIQNPELGIKIVQPLRVQPDPQTGRLITTAEDMPQLPFSHFRLHFREGARSPLVTPPGCGTQTVSAKLYPSSGGPAVQSDSSFQIISGANGSPCPQGPAPFNPGFEAGSINNAAGHYSSFDMRLTRSDGDQDLTKFSAKLPPGMIGKLAGTARCPAPAIAKARSRTGPHGGEEEQRDPSCPADSRIGSVEAGAGVGSVLTYVPGSLYLAGAYNGAPLSVVAIVPALAGPFDAGTVVTQEALRINPLTAEVEADGSASDPIPHILQGIPLKVRDVRVHVDKPDFTLNPTSCEPSATLATIWSGGSDVFSSADDTAHALQARFQAADCASLGFSPDLALELRGSKPTRGGHPALRGVFTPHKGDANLRELVLRFPRSAFLDQAHIRTICTRVQFAANGGDGGGCPQEAIYGYATAYTPLLEEPLSGPVYLRSSSHNLPDFVAALHGLIDVEAVARIDSKHGGIRVTFPVVPDAPLSRVVVNMQGGKKGLIINSKDLCYRPGRNRADASYLAHNGKQAAGKPVMRALTCKGTKRKKRALRRMPEGRP